MDQIFEKFLVLDFEACHHPEKHAMKEITEFPVMIVDPNAGEVSRFHR